MCASAKRMTNIGRDETHTECTTVLTICVCARRGDIIVRTFSLPNEKRRRKGGREEESKKERRKEKRKKIDTNLQVYTRSVTLKGHAAGMFVSSASKLRKHTHKDTKTHTLIQGQSQRGRGTHHRDDALRWTRRIVDSKVVMVMTRNFGDKMMRWTAHRRYDDHKDGEGGGGDD